MFSTPPTTHLPPLSLHDALPISERRRAVHLDRQLRHQCEEARRIGTPELAPSFGDEEDVHDLKGPEGRHQGFVRLQCHQDRVGVAVPLVLEAPGDGDRAIQDEPAHRRPWATASRTEIPLRRRPFPKARTSAITSASGRVRPSSAGTRTGTGTPCRTVVMRAPFATRLSSLGRLVFASYTPTRVIGASSIQTRI